MTDIAVADDPALTEPANWPWRIAVAALLTALADWLFFRAVPGVSVVLFILAVAAAVRATQSVHANRRTLPLHFGILVAALLPAIEDLNGLSALVAALGLGTFTLGVTGHLNGDLKEKAFAVGWYLLSGPFQFFRDLPLIRDWARQRGAPVNLTTVQGWIVPLVLGSIFLGLFAAANPLIADWLAQWNLSRTIHQVDMQRFLFWLATMIVVWAFVCVSGRFARPAIDDHAADLVPAFTYSSLIFNDAAVMRSLVLFNLLFAVQTIMDVNYLWRGAALPDGMSYASYAHRGAYPLIVTALLAAAFVIVAMRGRAARRNGRRPCARSSFSGSGRTCCWWCRRCCGSISTWRSIC